MRLIMNNEVNLVSHCDDHGCYLGSVSYYCQHCRIVNINYDLNLYNGLYYREIECKVVSCELCNKLNLIRKDNDPDVIDYIITGIFNNDNIEDWSFDKKTNTLNITIIPKTTVEKIDLNIELTENGIIYDTDKKITEEPCKLYYKDDTFIGVIKDVLQKQSTNR